MLDRSPLGSPFDVGLTPSPFPFADSREITSERSLRSLLSLVALVASECLSFSATALRLSLSFPVLLPFLVPRRVRSMPCPAYYPFPCVPAGEIYALFFSLSLCPDS